MKTKKFIAAIIVAVMAVASFASCGTTTATDAPATDAPATQAATQAPITAPTAAPATVAPTEASTSGRPTPAPLAPENILKFGSTGNKGMFNPVMSDNVYDAYVCDLIFQALITNDSEGNYIGSVIADWELTNNNLTYRFTLKDGIKFEDGTSMTTADVEFTYLTIAHPDYDGPRAYAVADMVGYEDFHAGTTDVFEGIKVIDEKVIEFTFPEGMASPANIECFAYGIMPKAYYEFTDWQDFIALNDKPLGSGYFKLDSWAPKEYINLLRNDNYWDAENGPIIAGISFMEVPEDSVLSALQTGQIDFANPGASINNVDEIKKMDNVVLNSFLGNGYTFLCFNTTRPTLNDVKVRQALMYALDRQAFIDIQYGSDLGSVGLAPLSPSSWAFPDTSSLNDYAFDLDKAAALMDEAGWKLEADGFRYKDGVKFSISWLVYTDSAWPGVLSEMAADTWKQLGVELKIELMDFVTVGSRTMDAPVADKDFDLYTMGFSLSIDPDPSGALFDYEAYTEGGFNASGYLNERSQELIKLGKNEFDQSKRAEIYQEWGQLMNEEIPTIIVAYRKNIWGINNRVHGFETQGTYSTWVQLIKDVTLDAQ